MKNGLLILFCVICAVVLIAIFGPGCKPAQLVSDTVKETTDSVTTVKIEHHYDTITESIQGATIFKDSPCPEKPFDIKEKKNGLVTEFKSDGRHETIKCDADSLRRVNDEKDIIINSLKTKIKTETKVEVKEIPRPLGAWDKFLRWFFWIALVIVALWLELRYLKR